MVENDGVDDQEEEEEEEEEEVPDTLTFGEKTLGLLVEGINKFQNNMLEFCAFSSRQSSETKSILSNLSKKLEKNHQVAGSTSSSDASSSSSSSSFSRHSSFEAESSSGQNGSSDQIGGNQSAAESSSGQKVSSFVERSLASA